MRKIISLIALSVFFSFALTNISFAQGNKTSGAEKIFEEIGMDKPAEWESWNRDIRFDYLQNLGIYPSNNGKYIGETGDLTEFFAKLNMEQPENWDSMSFEEKKQYITPSEETSEPDTTINTTQPATNEVLLQIAIVIAFSILLSLGIRFRKFFDPIIYYGLPLGLVVYSFFNPTTSWFNLLGTGSKLLLIFLIFIKPIAKILQSKLFMQVVGYRRQLGIATFWLYLFHTGGLMYTYNFFSIDAYLKIQHLTGILAGIGLFILGITSNDISIKLLKGHWKKIQYLAYPVLLGVLAHTSLAEDGNFNSFYIISSIFIVLKILEWTGFKLKKSTPTK